MTRVKNTTRTAPVALDALKRAAKSALKLAQQTGTACYVEVNGKIVDIARSTPGVSKGSAGPSTTKKGRPPTKRK